MCSVCSCSVYDSTIARDNGSAIGSNSCIDSGGASNSVCGNGVDIGVANSIDNYIIVVLD